MEQIPGSVLSNLLGIVTNIVEAIKKDLFFPPKTPSVEEQLASRMKQLSALVESQQNSLLSQAEDIKDQSRRIQELEDLNHQKDQRIHRLNEAVSSLGFELQTTNYRTKH